MLTCCGLIGESLCSAHVERNPKSQTCIFNSYIYHRAHIRAFLSWIKRFFATNCYGNMVAKKFLSLPEVAFAFVREQTRGNENGLWWINHDIAHINELFLPNSKVATEKKALPKYYDVCRFYSRPSLHFQRVRCWNVPEAPPSSCSLGIREGNHTQSSHCSM